MYNVILDGIDPKINVYKDPGHGTVCTFLQINLEGNNQLVIHFDNNDDLKAFVGLMKIAIGEVS